MSDKKEDTLMPGYKLVADDDSGVEIEYKGPKNKAGKYLVSVQNPSRGKSPVLKRMTSADMHNPKALDQAKEILKKESKNVPFQVGRFTVTTKKAAKKSQGGKKRRKTKTRKRRRKRKTRRRSRKRKRRTRRRRR